MSGPKRDARSRQINADPPAPRNLPELMAYAEANRWTLVDDPPSTPPSE